MFRSRVIFDRKLWRKKKSNISKSPSNNSSATKENNRNSSRIRTIDGNNNNTRRDNNNFHFIEPCDIVDDLNNEIDSLDSIEIKNWRYHLTNNKF